MRGRKYRNSIRPNRVTGSGFWKATGIDRPIYSPNDIGKCIGLKKSLVYYRGSAGKGTKTDWMMHEFRLPPATKNDANNPPSLQEAVKIPNNYFIFIFSITFTKLNLYGSWIDRKFGQFAEYSSEIQHTKDIILKIGVKNHQESEYWQVMQVQKRIVSNQIPEKINSNVSVYLMLIIKAMTTRYQLLITLIKGTISILPNGTKWPLKLHWQHYTLRHWTRMNWSKKQTGMNSEGWPSSWPIPHSSTTDDIHRLRTIRCK